MPTEDPSRVARLAELIASDFYGERGLQFADTNVARDAPTRWQEMPEVRAVRNLRESGADDRLVRLFLTFTSAMNRNRNFEQLVDAARSLFQLHPQLWEPSEAAAIPLPRLADHLSHSGVSRKHSPDARAWSAIARSLTEESPVSTAVNAGVGSASELLRDLGTKGRFPLLRGPKIAPLWLGMLVAPGGAQVSDLQVAPVAVDVHVRRASEDLGICDTRGWPREVASSAIQYAWRDAVSVADVGGAPGTASTCAALNAPLWVLGKFGCDHYKKLAEE